MSHELKLCAPEPSDSWQPGVLPGLKKCNEFKRDLANYPFSDTPSGGTSRRISPSEMYLAYVKLDNYPGSGYIEFVWTDNDKNREMYRFRIRVDACGGNCSWSWWYWWAYSFVGYFAGEIDHAGQYSVFINTSWGDALFWLAVTDSKAEQAELEKLRKKIDDLAKSVDKALGDLWSKISDLGSRIDREIEERKKAVDDIWARLEAWLIERIVGILLKGLDREVEGKK